MLNELSRQQRRVLLLLAAAVLLGAVRLGFRALSRGDVEVHLVAPVEVAWPGPVREGTKLVVGWAGAMKPPGETGPEESAAGEAAPVPPGDAAAEEAASFRLDPNTASYEELQILPGIGPVLAARIIEYRETVGKFQTIDDLLAVKGIGEKTLAKIRPYLVIKE
ncbi:MAG: helix-hairpin-helix domain-containing protein [Firmicutes bacterium]|nr:helix-hairpin-helix domain-containing protein [Bacillota bacterium]